MFGRSWSPATGTVLSSRVKSVNTASEHGASITMEFVVEVLSVDGTTQRAVVPDGRYSDWWAPKIGQRVKVEIEAKSGRVRFDKSDLGLSFKEHERITSSAFDAARDRLERS